METRELIFLSLQLMSKWTGARGWRTVNLSNKINPYAGVHRVRESRSDGRLSPEIY